jgi:hypothetical protein
MPNRHDRRKALSTYRKTKLKSSTLDQHFEETVRRVRAEFEHSGGVHPVFHCVSDAENFDIPAQWPDRTAKAATCAALRDSFRRRGVKRYLFASEAWVGKTSGFAPADDPDRGECVQVLAVEHSGARKLALAEIRRTERMTTLGPWEVKREADIPQSWLLELLTVGHSDRPAKAEPPLVCRMSNAEFLELADQCPQQAAELHGSVEIHTELGCLVSDEIQKAQGDPTAMYMALESGLRSTVKEMGSPKGLGQFARFLRDHPDKFPMFPTAPNGVPSTQHFRSCKDKLRQFICEKRDAGYSHFAIFQAFMNMYMWVGAQAIGALGLADRIEDWDPEHQRKLQQMGLRSSFELDDEEGKVFVALSAERYPFGVMGRRNAAGDLFVSRVMAFPDKHFALAMGKLEECGVDLIMGSEAEELLRKMEQAKGNTLRAEKSNEIWEVENWGQDEWVEQALAEIAFAKAMKVQHVSECNKLYGSVAGYRVRRAANGLVLVCSDNDEDIFVAVKVETTKRQASFLGWLRGSEGKVPQFYQKNCWVIPAEILHDIETLPGKELRTVPPSQELSS